MAEIVRRSTTEQLRSTVRDDDDDDDDDDYKPRKEGYIILVNA